MLNESPLATNDVNLDYEVDFFFTFVYRHFRRMMF